MGLFAFLVWDIFFLHINILCTGGGLPESLARIALYACLATWRGGLFGFSCFPVFRKFTSWFLGHTWVWFHLWLSPLGLCCKCWRLAVSIGSLCSGDHCCPNCSLWKMSVLKGLKDKVETVVMFVTFTGWWEPAYRDGIWRGGCGLMPESCYANI